MIFITLERVVLYVVIELPHKVKRARMSVPAAGGGDVFCAMFHIQSQVKRKESLVFDRINACLYFLIIPIVFASNVV